MALASGARFYRALAIWGLLAMSAALCLLVFTPWSREPLDILDFSEFLLQMEPGSSIGANWHRLAIYYATQGRVNEVPYWLIATTYHMFGLDPLGWQAARSLQMLVLPPAVYLLLRRYGVTPFGAVLGASLFLIGTVPASSWLRQTAEPVATLSFLGAAGLACGFSQEPVSWKHLLAVSFCVTGMLLSKETLVACLPFLVLVAAGWQTGGRVRGVRLDRRTAWFAGACAVGVVGLAIALGWARTALRGDAYATLYNPQAWKENLSVGRVLPFLLPIYFPTLHPFEAVLFAPNLIFVSLMALGALTACWSGQRDQLAGKLLIATTLPLGGLVVYLPWPRFELFYGLPFLLGTSLCVGILLGELGRSSRWKAAILPCWVVVLGVSALMALGQARYTRARREVNRALASDLAKYGPADTVMIGSGVKTPQSWQRPAATLGRYALATGASVSTPVLLDVSCEASASILGQRQRHVTLFVYVGWCGEIGVPDRRIQHPFSYFEWGARRMRSTVFAVDVFEQRLQMPPEGSAAAEASP